MGEAQATYTSNVFAALVMILVDIILNGVIENQTQTALVIALCAAHIVVRVVSTFPLLMLAWSTFVFRFGLFGALCRKCKWMLLTLPISVALVVAYRVNRIILQVSGQDAIEIWNSSTYPTLFYFNSVVSIMYYVTVLYTCSELNDPILYQPSKWLYKG